MTSFYDTLVAQDEAQPQAAPAQQPVSFYDTLKSQDEDEGKLRASVAVASKTSPDKAAQQQHLARVTGLPLPVVQTNEGEAQARAKFQEINELAKTSPVLKARLMDPTFTSVAQDDTPVLSAIEKGLRNFFNPSDRPEAIRNDPQVLNSDEYSARVRQFKDRYNVDWDTARSMAKDGMQLNNTTERIGDWVKPGMTLGNWVNGKMVGFTQGLEQMRQGLNRMAGDVSGNEGMSERARIANIRSQNQIDLNKPQFAGATAQGLDSGVDSLLQNLPGMALGVATGTAVPALAMIGLQSQSQAYSKYRDRGASGGMASLGSAGEGATEVATEVVPMGVIVNQLGKVGFGHFMKEFLGKEMLGEQVNTAINDAIDTAIANPDKTWGEYLAERPGAAYQTALATLVQSGVLAGGSHILSKTTMAKQASDFQVAHAIVADQKLQQMFKLAAQSDLRTKSPQTFAEVSQEMAEKTEGAPTEVRFDARTLGEVLNQEELAKLPSVASQMQEALATGGEVTVPLGELMANVAGTPLEQKLTEHARVGDAELSAFEAKEAQAQAETYLQEEAKRVISEASDSATHQASADKVKTALEAQFTALGRFTPDVNSAYATIASNMYTALGSRLDMTPEEAYAAHPLNINGVNPATQGETLNAGPRTGALTVEGYHYSKQARTSVSTDMFGTGLAGSSKDEYLNAKDKRLSKRAYFYVDKGTGINPETGVGGYAHKAQLSNIYDADTDPLRLNKGGKLAFESAVLDAGFSGYLNRLGGSQSGQVVLLGQQKDTAVEGLGQMAKTNGAVVPAKGTRESLGRDQIVDALQANAALPSGSPTLAHWQELLANQPDVLKALTDAGVFAGDQTQNVYKSELIKAFEAATEAPVYSQAKTSDVKLPKKATATTAVDIRKGPALTGDQRMDIHQVGAYFDKIAGGAKDINDPKAFAKALKTAVAEIEHQLTTEKNGLDWYEEEIKTAFEVTQRVIPELADPAQRQLFSVIAGLQSPGTNARDNWSIAAEAFQSYKATGVVPGRNPKTGGLWAGGPVSVNKEKSLNFLNAMVQDLGESATIDWLMGTHTVKELNDARAKWGNMGPGVSGKANDTLMGLFAFGPKVGPFVMNINGIHELTIDVWATRTFNRYFGQMIGPDGKIIDAPTEPQRRVAKELFNAAAEKTGIKPYQVQSVLWFAEQQLFNHLGTGTPSYGFSDGARKFASNAGLGGGLGTDGGNAKTSAGELDGQGTYEQAGNGSGREEGRNLTPLEGSPSVPGFHGPDPRIVAVAEQYARDNGIELRRQDAYVKVDPERAKRIADAYEAMAHNPQDPAVKEAYQNLIQQTMAQYKALEAAGYKFHFIDLNSQEGQDYASTPWNAMRDTRANQRMGVFSTEAGFGSAEDFNPEANPLLEDTGLQWPLGKNGAMQRVLANDLFRAVHDAFGHGMEGAGFRADGEENAWQAHSRLFTGSALGAITSETRGQNSWLNYGPYGEANRTAKIEDTHFADQKTGLMPSWTWTEGRAGNEGENKYQAKYLSGRELGALGEEERAQYDALADSPVLNQTSVLLAPNGNPSNLSAAHHALVRTPEFKAWFGDWEAGNVWARDDVSKAVDENGEPLVLYHGTDKGGFTEFKTPGGTRRGDLGIFLTPNREMARSYVKKGRGQDLAREDLNGNPSFFGSKSGIYPLFVNIRNPNEANFEGANWDGSRSEQWTLDMGDGEPYVDPLTGKQYFSEKEARAIAKEFAAPEDEYEGADFMKAAEDGYESTDSVVREARTYKNDGAIIREVMDDGGGNSSYSGDPSDVFVVFNPSQVKSVENFGTFNPNDPNIFHAPNARGTFNPKSMTISLLEGADLSTFHHEMAHFYLEVLTNIASQPNAPASIAGDMDVLLKWFGMKPTYKGMAEDQYIAAINRGGKRREFNEAMPLSAFPDTSTTGKTLDTVTTAKGVSVTLAESKDVAGAVLAVVDGKVVGYVAPEGGTTGLFVADEYRRQGVGQVLSTFYRTQNPMADSGGFSDGGEHIAREVFRKLAGSPLDAWNALSLNEKRASHEKFAEHYEQYLFEGKSPNMEIQPLFQRFASWMKNVYQSLSKFMADHNSQLTDEVRGVYDRMLATENQITEAESARNYAPLFKSAEQAGMTPEGWALYQLQAQDATEQAIENLQARSLRDLKWTASARAKALKAATKDVEAKRKSTEAEVRAEVEQMPVYAAKSYLDSLKGDRTDADLQMTSELFGFSSPDQMLREMVEAQPIKHVIDGMTDQRLLERYGDLTTPQGIERAANEAIHNEARARFVATELKALNEGMRISPPERSKVLEILKECIAS
ncbi:NAT_SF domain containing protein [uncultured Caudovirales phage]|uniref:NAT_SF domain containing protein n=1 Tax=uncultured Caudovirales phage TaxID=2100421 RepID=A0A6J5KUE4_9CAUD|nr:NAT_SF domain containing protein [uncultured Caudovirales phage]